MQQASLKRYLSNEEHAGSAAKKPNSPAMITIPLDYHTNAERELREYMRQSIDDLRKSNGQLAQENTKLNDLLSQARKEIQTKQEELAEAMQWKARYERCKAKRALRRNNQPQPNLIRPLPTNVKHTGPVTTHAKHCWLVALRRRPSLDDLWLDVEACDTAVVSGMHLSLIRTRGRTTYADMETRMLNLYRQTKMDGPLLLEWYSDQPCRGGLMCIELAHLFRHIREEDSDPAAASIARYAKISPAIVREGDASAQYRKRVLPMKMLV